MQSGFHADEDNPLPPVYAASYDHIGVILWGEKQLSDSIERALDWLERHPNFRIGWDHEAFTYDYLAEYAPSLLARIRDALHRYSPRLGLSSCTYGQPLSMFINEESNIRQLTMAQQTCQERLGYPISIYLVSEHAFHAQMPQLLAGCGFSGAVLRTHFMMYGHNPEFDAPVGWWTGVDGSRIPTLPTYCGQAATPSLINHILTGNTSTLDNRILTDAPSERVPLTLADFRRAFGERIQPLVATRADDVRALEALIENHESDADYQWVTLEDIFDLLPQPRAEFLTQPNDFKVRMPWGYCGSWIWQRTREAEIAVLTAERLNAVCHALTGASAEAELELAWKNLLTGQHHDIHICGLEQDARRYLGEAISTSQAVSQHALALIARCIGVEGPRTVVFNPLPWERVETAETPEGSQTVTLPALGFAAFKSSQPATAFKWNAASRLLETPFYEVEFADKGGFKTLRSAGSGRALMTLPKSSGVLAGLIDGRWCESVAEITGVDLTPARAIITEAGEIGGLPFWHTWTFYPHRARIDWHGRITFSGQVVGRSKSGEEDPFAPDDGQRLHAVPAFNDHEYKLRLRFFPYLSPYAVGVRDYPFGVAETADRVVQGVYWTAAADGYVGLALFNRGLMGSLREPDGAFSSVLAFSMPYIWGTRILNDACSYDLGILPFEGGWRAADLHRQALEYNFPPLATDITVLENSLGESWTPFVDRGSGALLSALYVHQAKTYARFHEIAGASAEAAFDWMGKPALMTETDLHNRPLARLGRKTRLNAWQIRTVCVEQRR